MTADNSHATVLVIHGPNLNMLGTREPHHYGSTTLDRINEDLRQLGESTNIQLHIHQSNHEGEIIDIIQSMVDVCDGVIINPGAYTHTSVGIRDALLLLDVPIIEVHLSNVHKREKFRHHSYLSDVVTGQIVGLGSQGYTLALSALDRLIRSTP